jgi:hypothetical protein
MTDEAHDAAAEAAYTGTPPVMARDMTLRDAVAIAALPALISATADDKVEFSGTGTFHDLIAQEAMHFADAFMAERAKGEG